MSGEPFGSLPLEVKSKSFVPVVVPYGGLGVQVRGHPASNMTHKALRKVKGIERIGREGICMGQTPFLTPWYISQAVTCQAVFRRIQSVAGTLTGESA